MDTTRRDVLRAGITGLAGGALALPQALAGMARAVGPSRSNALVVIELAGGNDWLNTVIPHSDPLYLKNRPTLAIAEGHPISERLSLHPALLNLKSMFDAGQVAIIQGAGYPRASRSHYRSAEVWHTACTDDPDASGWLGRSMQALACGGVASGRVMPLLLKRGQEPFSSQRLMSPDTGDAAALEKVPVPFIADLVATQPSARIFYARVEGFDTHADQGEHHHHALWQLDAAIGAMMARLDDCGMAERVTVMCFSEFGRGVAENPAGGTDHGAAGGVLVLGKNVRGGIYGRVPSLDDLEDGGLKYTIDFRRVYATLLDKWLGCDSRAVLGARYETLAFV